jgi:hypothetical protein
LRSRRDQYPRASYIAVARFPPPWCAQTVHHRRYNWIIFGACSPVQISECVRRGIIL